MRAGGVASNVALGTFLRVLASKRKHVTTVTAPVCAEIGKCFESMGNTMLDLFLITLLLCNFHEWLERNKGEVNVPRRHYSSRYTW